MNQEARIIFNLQKIIKNSCRSNAGFTFLEMILYVAIISIMLSALIPFTWNIIESGTKSATQEEVSSQVRNITERIKWEIRNAISIVSPNPGQSGTSLTLCENSANCASAANQLTIARSTTVVNGTTIGIVTIAYGGSTAVQLSSNSVTVFSANDLNFTNNSSATTKNVSFSLKLQQAYTGGRKDFQASETATTSAELRNF